MVVRGSVGAGTTCPTPYRLAMSRGLRRPAGRWSSSRPGSRSAPFAPDWEQHDVRPTPGSLPMNSSRDPDNAGQVVDVASIEEIVTQHSAAVFRLARSVVQDASLADDVTQETFIKVWRNLDSFRGESSMRSWILRIAHNTAVSTLRKIRDSATDPDKLPRGSESDRDHTGRGGSAGCRPAHGGTRDVRRPDARDRRLARDRGNVVRGDRRHPRGSDSDGEDPAAPCSSTTVDHAGRMAVMMARLALGHPSRKRLADLARCIRRCARGHRAPGDVRAMRRSSRRAGGDLAGGRWARRRDRRGAS